MAELAGMLSASGSAKGEDTVEKDASSSSAVQSAGADISSSEQSYGLTERVEELETSPERQLSTEDEMLEKALEEAASNGRLDKFEIQDTADISKLRRNVSHTIYRHEFVVGHYLMTIV